MKHRVQESEARIQPRHWTSGCAWTRKLETGGDADGSHRGGRAPERWAKAGGRAGLSKRKWAGRLKFARFGPLKGAKNRLRPPSPTLIFPGGAWNRYGKRSAGVLEYWGAERAGKRRARNYAEKITRCYGFFREVPRKFAQIRAVFTRCLASQARHKLGSPNGLFACAKRGRIFTGESFFYK